MSGTDLSQVSEASARSHSSEDPVGERVIGRRIIATQRAVDESLAAWLSKMDDLVDRGVFGTHDWTSYEDEKAYVKSYFERHAHLSDGRKNTMALKNELDTLQRESAMNNTILESLSHVLNDIPPILPPDLDLETRKRTERLERELQEERDELKAQRAKLKEDQERFEQQKEELLEQFTKTKHEWETRVLEKLDDDQKRKDREASSAAQTSKEKDLLEAIESLRKFREDQVFEKHVKEMEARNVHNELEKRASEIAEINNKLNEARRELHLSNVKAEGLTGQLAEAQSTCLTTERELSKYQVKAAKYQQNWETAQQCLASNTETIDAYGTDLAELFQLFDGLLSGNQYHQIGSQIDIVCQLADQAARLKAFMDNQTDTIMVLETTLQAKHIEYNTLAGDLSRKQSLEEMINTAMRFQIKSWEERSSNWEKERDALVRALQRARHDLCKARTEISDLEQHILRSVSQNAVLEERIKEERAKKGSYKGFIRHEVPLDPKYIVRVGTALPKHMVQPVVVLHTKFEITNIPAAARSSIQERVDSLTEETDLVSLQHRVLDLLREYWTISDKRSFAMVMPEICAILESIQAIPAAVSIVSDLDGMALGDNPRAAIYYCLRRYSALREQVPLDPTRVAQGMCKSYILRVESLHLLRVLNQPFKLPAYLGRLGGWYADLEERLQDEGNPAAICEFWNEMLHPAQVLPPGELHVRRRLTIDCAA